MILKLICYFLAIKIFFHLMVSNCFLLNIWAGTVNSGHPCLCYLAPCENCSRWAPFSTVWIPGLGCLKHKSCHVDHVLVGWSLYFTTDLLCAFRFIYLFGCRLIYRMRIDIMAATTTTTAYLFYRVFIMRSHPKHFVYNPKALRRPRTWLLS